MTQAHQIRIFLASPQDTLAVREIVAGVVDEINHDSLLVPRLQIELRRWDDPKHPVPCSFLRNPQHDVSTFTGDPNTCDLVIGLFRHRFGSPLPAADFGLSPDGDARALSRRQSPAGANANAVRASRWARQALQPATPPNCS